LNTKYLTILKLQEALDNCIKKGRRSKRQRNFLILKTLAESGLRVSELINLIPYNVGFETHILYIKGKGNKIRSVDISTELSQLLEMYIKTEDIKNKNPIFPLTRDGVRKITLKNSGFSPHAFRHTYAINLLRTTRNIRYVQKQLGHSSLNMTEIYLQFIEFDQEKKQLSGLYSLIDKMS
jgi:integrase/recombinase XerC/integrase/recombinase XerD